MAATNKKILLNIFNPEVPVGDKLFAFKIDYDQPEGDGTPLYNRNISATYWRVKGDDKKRSYI